MIAGGRAQSNSKVPRGAPPSPDQLEHLITEPRYLRLAYYVFALDVEHALLFGHERSMYGPLNSASPYLLGCLGACQFLRMTADP